MARKRLADLLREEAQKPVDIAATPVVETPPPAKRTSRSRKTNPTNTPTEAATETVEAVFVEVVESSQGVGERSPQYDALKQENIALQQELDRQESKIHALQADLEKAQSFKTELEQAKHDALKLAEENTRLAAKLAALEQQTTATPTPAPAPTAPPVETTLTSTQRMVQQQARSLAHPIFPAGPSPGQLSEQDLGWVD